MEANKILQCPLKRHAGSNLIEMGPGNRDLIIRDFPSLLHSKDGPNALYLPDRHTLAFSMQELGNVLFSPCGPFFPLFMSVPAPSSFWQNLLSVPHRKTTYRHMNSHSCFLVQSGARRRRVIQHRFKDDK